MSTRRLNDPSFLKGFWPLNNHVNDVSGNGNNGTATSVTYTNGPLGRSVVVSTTTSIITVPDSSLLRTSSKFSFGGWVYLTTFSGNYRLFAKSEDSNNYYVLAFANSTGQLSTKVVLNGSSAETASPNNSIVVNKLYHVFGTYNSGVVTTYINGVSVSGGTAVGFASPSGTNLNLINNSTAVLGIPGNVFNLRFYNIALTGAEVLALYQLGQNPQKAVFIDQPLATLPDVTDSTLFAAYLNKKTLGTYNDYSNNYNTATATNASSIQVTSRGVRFDGVAVAGIGVTTNALKVANATLMCWVKPETFSGTKYFMCYEASSASRFLVGFEAGGSRVFTFDDINDDNITTNIGSTGYMIINQWHHVAVVINSNGTKDVYINGSYKGSSTQTTGNFSNIVGNPILNFGRSSTVGLGMTGEMFDARAYTRAVSADEISTIYAQGVPDSSLLLHLINGSKDHSRYSRALTNVATVVGSGMSFSGGSTSYITIPDATELRGNAPYTVMFWVKSNSIATTQNILEKPSAAYQFDINSSKARYFLQNSDNSITIATGATILESNRWYHVVGVRTSDTMYLYVNGVLDGSTSNTKVVISSTVALGIGQDFTAVGVNNGNGLNGSLKDLKIFSEAKSADYILDYYNKTRKYY